MKTTTTLLHSVILGAFVSLLLTSCASERVKAEAKEHKDEYVDYYPVGSNIPIRIPKDQAKASSEETAKTEAAFRDIQRSTQTPETGPQSGVPGMPAGGGSR